MNYSIGLALVMTFLFSAASAKYGFTPSQSEVLNRRLQACLDELGCRIPTPVSICRKKSDQPGQSPTSCHLQCRAIDIFRVQCSKTGSTDNNTNLHKLARCLRAPGFLTCYDGVGGCHDPHRDHLHFGADEGRKCRAPGETNPLFLFPEEFNLQQFGALK